MRITVPQAALGISVIIALVVLHYVIPVDPFVAHPKSFGAPKGHGWYVAYRADFWDSKRDRCLGWVHGVLSALDPDPEVTPFDADAYVASLHGPPRASKRDKSFAARPHDRRLPPAGPLR